MFESFPPFTLYAHRGSSAHAPENTLAAFRLAAAQRADAVELDAKLTRDGEVIVIHDPTVDRTTNGAGQVKDLTLAEIKELDAGSFFSEAFRSEPIPKLSEVFEEVGRQVLINVELTNYAAPADDLPEKAAELVRRHGLEGRVIFSSFLPANLARARKALPGVPNALLTLPGWKGHIVRLSAKTPREALHPYFSDVTARLVAAEHRRGRKVNVWTVDTREEMVRLLALHVDGIITDDPVLARQILTG